MESVGKHAQTTNPVSALSTVNFGGGSYNTGAELVVLGFDPLDVHTDNFWELLGSEDLGSVSTTMDSGTITAKKYLWIQYYYNSGGSPTSKITFNSDTGSNYTDRASLNGATDTTNINQTSIPASEGNPATFVNLFIINNSANEKLVTGHSANRNVAAASNVPRRNEFIGKWVNTSSQITKVTVTGNVNFGTKSSLRVWGGN